MDPKEQQSQGKEYVEWSKEAKENMFELMLTLMEMKKSKSI